MRLVIITMEPFKPLRHEDSERDEEKLRDFIIPFRGRCLRGEGLDFCKKSNGVVYAGPGQGEKMKHKGLRIIIGVITGFIALTAIGGGIALLSGAEAERFPLEWLQGSPFKDYTIPALLLTIVVGGSSLIACITTFRGLATGITLSLAAGMIMMGYILGEVLILKQVPPGPTPTEKIYFALGFITFVLAGFLWGKEKRWLVQN